MNFEKKLVIVRGHQGSGKSTFAKEIIEKFKLNYPNALIFHWENDKGMINEKGEYHFSNKAFSKSKHTFFKTYNQFLKQIRQGEIKNHILLIISNVNQSTEKCMQLIKSAEKVGIKDIKVFCLKNFFDNIHNVPDSIVFQTYKNINDNPVPNEIILPIVQPMNEHKKSLYNKWLNGNLDLTYDKDKHSFVTKEYLQTHQSKYVVNKTKDFPNLLVLKYAKKVFFENSFDKALLEMRGLILDKYYNIIVRPFKKVFNYSELIDKNSQFTLKIKPNHKVDAVVKVNGFLGVCTYVQLDKNHQSFNENFNHTVLYSTTGTLDSKFAHMVKQHCQKYETLFKQYPNHTFLFEINDESDQHIIKEEFGETFIGLIDVATGKQWTETNLNKVADDFNQKQKEIHSNLFLKRPQVFENISFQELQEMLKNIQLEGFMVFDHKTKEILCKMKSPFYLMTKLFARKANKNLNSLLDKKNLEEEYFPLQEYLQANPYKLFM